MKGSSVSIFGFGLLAAITVVVDVSFAQVKGVCVRNCASPPAPPSRGGGSNMYPEPYFDPQQENWNIALSKNKGGIEAWNRGDFSNAVTFFEEAARLWPENQVFAANLRDARQRLQAQREEEQRRIGMQQGLDRMADVLNNTQPAVSSGLNFDGGSQGSAPGVSSAGLDFMPASPTKQAPTAMPPAASGCGVNTDASVVDLCGMGERLVVDPSKLKPSVAVASAPRPPDPSAAAAKRELDIELDNLFKKTLFDETSVREFDRQFDELFKRHINESYSQHHWPGPSNPGPRLINPLNEPKRYEAWTKATDARLKIQAQKGKDQSVIERMNRDSGLNAARDRIVQKQQQAEAAAFRRAQQDIAAGLEKLRKEAHLKDFQEFQRKEQQDPNFRSRVDEARDAIVQRWEREEQTARSNAIQEMDREVNNWQSAHTRQ